MKFTDPLVIDLNDKTLFPDYYTYSWEKTPEALTFSDKTADKIINEVAARARKVLGYK